MATNKTKATQARITIPAIKPGKNRCCANRRVFKIAMYWLSAKSALHGLATKAWDQILVLWFPLAVACGIIDRHEAYSQAFTPDWVKATEIVRPETEHLGDVIIGVIAGGAVIQHHLGYMLLTRNSLEALITEGSEAVS